VTVSSQVTLELPQKQIEFLLHLISIYETQGIIYESGLTRGAAADEGLTT
jgi:hypothetical protein